MSFAHITITLSGKATAVDTVRILRELKKHEEFIEEMDYKVD